MPRFASSGGVAYLFLVRRGSRSVKTFFIIVLVVSILFPVYMLVAGLGVMVHNQYDTRLRRLDVTEPPKSPGMHLGLTGSELATLDEKVVFAYKDAVHDGYRLGHGYSMLWLDCVALDILLFLTSIFGLRACSWRSRLTNRSSQPLAGLKTTKDEL